MATILTKKKDTTGAPSAGDLTNSTGGAELAVNTADKRLYTKDSGGNVVEIGTAPSTIDINAGTIDGTTIGGSTPAAGSFTTLNTSGAVVFNDAGADVDFRVEGDTDANLLFVDASADAVGIGTSSPDSSAPLTVARSGGNSRIVVRRTNATTGAGQNFLELQAQNSSLDPVGVLAFRRDTADTNAYFTVFTGGSERMRIDSSGNLLIGRTNTTIANNTGTIITPTFTSIASNSNGTLLLRNCSPTVSANIGGVLRFDAVYRDSDSDVTDIAGVAGLRESASSGNFAGYLAFSTTPNGGTRTERMRIDSSGNLLVGTTDPLPVTNNDSDGIALRADGNAQFSRASAACARFNRKTNDGEIVSFSKDGTSVGSIGTDTGAFNISGVGAGGDTGFTFVGTAIVPTDGNATRADNSKDLGAATVRWDDIFATNGTIQTSDRNEKQDIEALSEAETRVAVAAKGLMKKYRWKSAVAEKGDDARIHFGIIAQDLKAAFEAEGLDAGRYAMFIHSAWWETQTEVPAVEAQEAVYETQTDEEGNEVQVLVSEAVEGKEAYTRTDTYMTEAEAPEGAVRKERMGIRYNELLAFIIAAL